MHCLQWIAGLRWGRGCPGGGHLNHHVSLAAVTQQCAESAELTQPAARAMAWTLASFAFGQAVMWWLCMDGCMAAASAAIPRLITFNVVAGLTALAAGAGLLQ